jgi:hypothetical protein
VVAALTKKLDCSAWSNARGERLWAVRKRAITIEEGIHVNPIDDSKEEDMRVGLLQVQGGPDCPCVEIAIRSCAPSQHRSLWLPPVTR